MTDPFKIPMRKLISEYRKQIIPKKRILLVDESFSCEDMRQLVDIKDGEIMQVVDIDKIRVLEI